MAKENQQPIGSGFGAKTPAADVVQGMDLSGKNVVVTGGYSGIGIEEDGRLVERRAVRES